MKALHLIKPRAFSIVDIPIPDLQSYEQDFMLVRTHWVSMCGSDISIFAGNKRYQSFPLAPGAPIHECVGQIVETTSNNFKSGDWVVAIPEGDQGLAEFFIARASKTVLLPPELAHNDTSCLIQPLSTVINAVDQLGNIARLSIAIIGLGSIGLLFCWLLKKRGANRIVGIDPCAYRCKLAKGLGVDQTYPLRSSEVAHSIRNNQNGWEPPNICIEAVGHQMDTLNDCIELIQKRGLIVAFGVPDHLVYAIEFETFFRKNAHLIAAVTPEWSEYLVKARDLFLLYRQELEPFVTHRLPIRSAQEAFTLYENHENGIVKAVLDATCWQ